MKKSTIKSIALALTLALACTVALAPTKANAGWDDRSDELPGLVNATPYFIAAGVIAAGAIVYLVVKHNSDKNHESAVTTTAPAPAVSVTDSTTTRSDSTQVSQVGSTDSQADLRIQSETKLNLYMNVTDDRSTYGTRKPKLDFSDMTLRAGVTIGF